MQKTAYEMRISDWSADVCSSDLQRGAFGIIVPGGSERCTQPVLACHMSLLSPAHVIDRVSGTEPAILDCDDWSSVRCSVCSRSTWTGSVALAPAGLSRIALPPYICLVH